MRSESEQRRNDTRVPRARQLRRTMTDAEHKLWWHLRELPVERSHFRRQATIGPYFADFACHRSRLVVEVDGIGHAETNQVIADDARTAFLNSRGYRVLRFWNNEVLDNIDGVMTVIHDAIHSGSAAAPPTPDPSPPLARARGGRGARGSASPTRTRGTT